MCLICGELVKEKEEQFINEKPVGKCTAHAYRCGLTCGVFLKIDECKILLLQIKISACFRIEDVTGCHVSAPYLDDYGETDPDFV